MLYCHYKIKSRWNKHGIFDLWYSTADSRHNNTSFHSVTETIKSVWWQPPCISSRAGLFTLLCSRVTAGLAVKQPCTVHSGACWLNKQKRVLRSQFMPHHSNSRKGLVQQPLQLLVHAVPHAVQLNHWLVKFTMSLDLLNQAKAWELLTPDTAQLNWGIQHQKLGEL